MDKRHTIIQLLADGKFHSGEELAAALGVSRAAIWKHLKQLKSDYSLTLFSVRGRGYRLSQPLELLDEAAILESISEDARARIDQLEVQQQIDSTNSYLMALGMTGAPSGYVCLAEQQTAGRGRRGRAWVSPFGSNIYLSILWRYNVGIAALSGISIAAGVAVAKALEAQGITGVGLKWPNDILVDGRKLAGLLMEVAGEQSGPSRVVLGVGLNTLLAADDAEDIDQPWIDLTRVAGDQKISRNHLSGLLISELIKMLSRFEAEGLTKVSQEWKRFDIYYDQPVVIKLSEQKQITGIHKGIDASGALLLQTGSEIKAYHGGEVSLRAV
ncbi:MAG: bifunctional biotin--[acetyl-CoA-carboxylase] ligase/biotin operon repressor BirA [Chromatiales bacterium]|nr:bifunctional biotin--[acetyl-CoA-carboxylase] ligase/biotin operon repressor BirA [Chromatiales bacterium]